MTEVDRSRSLRKPANVVYTSALVVATVFFSPEALLFDSLTFMIHDHPIRFTAPKQYIYIVYPLKECWLDWKTIFLLKESLFNWHLFIFGVFGMPAAFGHFSWAFLAGWTIPRNGTLHFSSCFPSGCRHRILARSWCWGSTHLDCGRCALDIFLPYESLLN